MHESKLGYSNKSQLHGSIIVPPKATWDWITKIFHCFIIWIITYRKRRRCNYLRRRLQRDVWS